MLTAEIDMRKLESVMARYVDRWGMNARDVVKSQSGLLMKDIVKFSAPDKRETLEKQIVRDIGSVFVPIQPSWFKNKQAGRGDVHWIAAGPQFLTGIPQGNYRDHQSASQMGSSYRVRKGKMGKKFTQAGYRGKQHVNLMNRLAVRKGQLAQFTRDLKARVGRLKASFAVAWGDNVLTPSGRLPAWVQRHLGSGAKGSYINGLETPGHPSFTIISNATGCERPRAIAVIKRAVNSRVHAMLKDLSLYAKGIKTVTPTE